MVIVVLLVGQGPVAAREQTAGARCLQCWFRTVYYSDKLNPAATFGVFLACFQRAYIECMEPLPRAFPRSRWAFLWPLVAAITLLAAGAVLAASISSTVAAVLIGGPLALLGFIEARRAFRWYRHTEPLVEVLEHCVIDVRFFKEWVLWQDVREIQLIGSGIIALKVDSEIQYARDWKCICQRVHALLGHEPLPKLLIVSGFLDCTPAELLVAIRRASRPYGIPIRRFPEAAATSFQLAARKNVRERLHSVWTAASRAPLSRLSWR